MDEFFQALQPVIEEVSDEMKTYFKDNKNTNWVITLSGQWDVLAEITFRTIYELQGVVNDFKEFFSGKINSCEMFFSRGIRVEHLVKDFYKELSIQTIEQEPRIKKIASLDKTDRQIISELCKNSENSILNIAENIGKSIDTASARIKALVKNKVIMKFFTEINPSKLGYTEYIYKIRLKNFDQEKVSSFAKEISENDNIKHAFIDMTGSCIMINFAYKEAKDLDHFTSSIRKKHHDIIDSQEYYLVKEQLKFDLFPEALLQD